ncbi:hypothetical protein [Phenylobacterium ferrooxidans]|uniref:Uncharacterized protein n=1 Tax=Phenylobacterium ferrooxidans TaxID=2982689 RepID=A0ABW6CLP2_9CAUL
MSHHTNFLVTSLEAALTLICAWLDRSGGTRRITALADMRISAKDDQANRFTISDLTPKLFVLEANAYGRIENEIGVLGDRYSTGRIGLAFSGKGVIEALSIVAHAQRLLTNLLAVSGRPQPKPAHVASWFGKLVQSYFRDHRQRDSVSLTFYLFGWDGSTPFWVKVRWGGSEGFSQGGDAFTDDTFLVSGEEATFVADEVELIQRAVRRHKNGLGMPADVVSAFEVELESQRSENAIRKQVEESVIERILHDANETVGGVLQKLEITTAGDTSLTRLAAEYGVPPFWQDDDDGELMIPDYVQLMGRTKRST